MSAEHVVSARVQEALRDITCIAEGNVPGGVVPFNEVLPIVEDREEMRALLTAAFRMLRDLRAGHPNACCCEWCEKVRPMVQP